MMDPGGVIRHLNRCVMEDEHLWNQIMELTPLKRWATAKEIAEWMLLCGRDQPVYDRAESANRWRRGRRTRLLARIGNAPDGKPSGAFLFIDF